VSADEMGVRVPTYSTVHHRLRRLRGPASRWPCQECDQPAREWAYDNSDPNELVGTNSASRVRYSLDLAHYDPLCRTCHRRRDREHLAGVCA